MNYEEAGVRSRELFIKCYYCDQMEDKMGGTCSTPGRDANCIQIYSKILKGRDYLRDLGVDGRKY